MKKNPFAYIGQVLKDPTIIGLQVLSLFVLILVNAISLATPLLSQKIIDTYFATQTFDTRLVIIIAIAVFATAIFSFIQSYIGGVMSEKIAYILRKMIATKYLQQTFDFIVKTKPSKILTVAMSDVNFIKQVIGQFIISTVTAVMLLVGSIFLMFSIDRTLTIWVIVVIPGMFAFLFVSFSKIGTLFKLAQEARDLMNRIIDENIKGSMLVRVFVSEKTESKKFEGANEKNREVGISITNMFAMLMPIFFSTSLVGSLLVIIIGGHGVINSHVTLGQLAAFSNYVVLFTMPIMIIGFGLSTIGQAFASLGRINEVLGAPVGFIDGKKKVAHITDIELRDVSFTFEDAAILKKVSMKINKGEKIGIIGLNGSGKTMILNQIVRLLDPTEGQVLINGLDMKDIKVNDLRAQIGLVFQENFLLDGSIAENIKFGRKIKQENVEKAAKIADVMEFAKKFPEQLAHEVGERGTTLSGGQKQRIMIARAIAGEPEVLILDDSTSMLDITTEQKIMANIKKSLPKITIVIVSQKIASLRDCDRIYVIDQGTVIDVGSHEQLLTSSKLYEEIEMTQRNYKT